MEQLTFAAILVWITLMSILLVWFRDYKECAIGGLGLFIFIVASVVTLRDMLYGEVYYNFLPVTMALFSAMALVLTQHVYGHFKQWWKDGRRTGKKLFY